MKMKHSTTYQFRINEQEKAETFQIFQEMGIKPAQAVRLFFRYVRKTHALPFPIEHTPNAKTAKILVSKEYVGPFETVDDLFAEKEEGYDEWLRARLESTIKKLDSGEMKSYSLEEVREHLKQRRAERRNQRNSPSI